jgi:hypothetical protein
MDDTAVVSRILQLMRAQPNARRSPKPDDVVGNFDVWFDGGAVKHDTGISRFQFTDGSAASIATSLFNRVQITLPDGRHVDVPDSELR